MFKLLRYFSITSLLAFILVTVLLGIFYYQTALNDLLDLEESKNVALTQAFANSLWPQFAPFVTSASGLEGDELRTHPETARLNRAVRTQMMELSVVRVKIFNLEGMTIFSTEEEQIGEDRSTNAGFLAARSGQVVRELTHYHAFNTPDHPLTHGDVFSIYLPIRRGNPAGPIEGIIELYSDVTPLLQKIEYTQRNIVGGVALILASLYAVLFFIVRYADGIIRRQYTERKRAEEALRESSQLLQSMYDTIPDAIIITDANLNVSSCNQSVQKILGYTPDELIGKHYSIFVSEEMLADSQQKAKQAELFEKGSIEQDDYYFKKKNGDVFPANFLVALLKDEEGNFVGMVGSIRDITERKQAEKELRKLSSAVEQTADTVVITDAEGVIEYVNPAFEKLTGYTKTEALGQTSRILKSGQHTPGFYEKMWETTLAGRVFRAVVINKKKDEVVYYEEKTITPIRNASGNITCFVSTGKDITERVRAEEALRRYADRLKTLHEIDRAILAALSSEAVAQAALSHIRGLVSCLRASVVEFDLAAHEARVFAVQINGKTEMREGARLSLDTFRFVEALEQGKVQWVKDILTLAQLSPMEQAMSAEGVRSYVSAPLIAQGELIGALSLEADSPGFFTADDLDIVGEVAASLAVAIRQVRLYEQTRQDAETKAVLLDEINHRVKNNLTAIIGLLYAERRHAGMEKQAVYQTIMQDLINRIQGLATVHSLLSVSEWAPLPLDELANRVIHASLQALPANKRVSVDVSPSPVRVTPKQANSLALVINELATNTVKYALPEQDAGCITVRIALEEETGPKGHTILFEFRDNGPGYPEKILQLERHNVGMYLVQTIVRKDLRGELVLHYDHGAVTIIRFKTKVGLKIKTINNEGQKG